MKENFKDRLIRLMNDKNIRSQYRLAKEINIRLTVVNNWFTGITECPNDSHLAVVADYFNVSPAWLKFGSKQHAPTLDDRLARIAKNLEGLDDKELDKIEEMIGVLKSAFKDLK